MLKKKKKEEHFVFPALLIWYGLLRCNAALHSCLQFNSKGKLVISIAMVLPYPVGTQLSIWLPSVPYMAAAATSTWNYTFSTDFLLRTKVSRDALYLEVAQLRRQRWVSLPQLDVSLFKMCPPLYYHICQFTIKFPLHLKSISTKCLTDQAQFYHIFGISDPRELWRQVIQNRVIEKKTTHIL